MAVAARRRGADGARDAAGAAALARATLARANGTGSVTVGTATQQLHSRLWVQRLGGSGAARATVSCTTRTRSSSSGVDSLFTFRIAPGRRQLLWRAGDGRSCEVTVTLHGAGRLRVALRGY